MMIKKMLRDYSRDSFLRLVIIEDMGPVSA